MNSKSWWDFFDEDPYEKVGRHVPSVMGAAVVVKLARISWAYLDWLNEVEQCDGQDFFRDNEIIHDPTECDFDTWMEGAVHQLYIEREKASLPRPAWCPQAKPWDLVDI